MEASAAHSTSASSGRVWGSADSSRMRERRGASAPASASWVSVTCTEHQLSTHCRHAHDNARHPPDEGCALNNAYPKAKEDDDAHTQCQEEERTGEGGREREREERRAESRGEQRRGEGSGWECERWAQ